MRIIKFRAKVKSSNHWIIGDLVRDMSFHPDRDTEDCVICQDNDYAIVDENTVGQYTGLKDNNGKEIYEGDVGEIKTQSGRIERFTVEWGIHRRDMKSGWTVDIPSFAFMVDGKATFPISDNYLNGHDLDIIEIIGNIYDNPSLLTQ